MKSSKCSKIVLLGFSVALMSVSVAAFALQEVKKPIETHTTKSKVTKTTATKMQTEVKKAPVQVGVVKNTVHKKKRSVKKISNQKTNRAIILPHASEQVAHVEKPKEERFNMTQNGKKMTPEDFDAWMAAHGIHIVPAKPASSGSVKSENKD